MAVSLCQVVLFWFLVSARYGYNSLKSCWLCDEKLLLTFCAASDTHFSAFINLFVNPDVHVYPVLYILYLVFSLSIV